MLGVVSWAGLVSADSDLKIAGFVDVPPTGAGGTLDLPLASGDPPVTILVNIGTPAIQVPVQITSSTKIKGKGNAVTLGDGDRVKVDIEIVGSTIVATKLERDKFPEIELRGTLSGLPAAGLPLPLLGGTTATVTLTVVPGVTVPVVLTSSTKIKDIAPVLTNGQIVTVEAVFKGGQLVATKITGAQDEEDEEDDDEGNEGD
jgi:hypothetical protein